MIQKKQKEINNANIKGAKANAVKYIKEKYGFETIVKSHMEGKHDFLYFMHTQRIDKHRSILRYLT